MIDLNMEITQLFTDYITQSKELQLYAQPDTNIILFRPTRGADQTAEDYHALIADFQQYLYANNRYISLLTWEGEPWLKCIFLNPYFGKRELISLQHLIAQFFK